MRQHTFVLEQGMEGAFVSVILWESTMHSELKYETENAGWIMRGIIELSVSLGRKVVALDG